jgi:hypothetical protein
MEVIQFPTIKGPLDFDGMGIEIDVEEQRKNWNATFTSAQTALRFCNLDHVKAVETVRKCLDADVLDEMIADWRDAIGFLGAAIAIMKAADYRAEISKDRALARTKRSGK